MLPKAIVELNLCRDAEASGSLDLDSTGHVWVLETLETTRALGRCLARELPIGAILLLSGPLGAGKTSLVQGLAEGLGISEPIFLLTFAITTLINLAMLTHRRVPTTLIPRQRAVLLLTSHHRSYSRS